MSPHTVLGWRLADRQDLRPGAVDAALACEAATLSFGPHTFDFAKSRTAFDDVQLRLSHRRDCACKDHVHAGGLRRVGVRSVERLVPAVTGDLDDETRASIEAERLSAIGRALFAHVSHVIVQAENAPPGKRALRLLPVSRRGSRSRQTFARGRICATPGCGTVLSTYNPSRTCELHR